VLAEACKAKFAMTFEIFANCQLLTAICCLSRSATKILAATFAATYFLLIAKELEAKVAA